MFVFDPTHRPQTELGPELVAALAVVYGHVALLSDDALDAPTRCSEWSASDVVNHLTSAAEYTTGVIEGRVDAFEGFDPNSTPGVAIEAHRADPPEIVRERFVESTASFVGVVRELDGGGEDRRVPSLWGVPYDWRALATHMCWDAWLHHRDIVVAAGGDAPSSPGADRLALCYGLYIGTVGAVRSGAPLEASVEVSGPGAARLEVEAGSDRHAVTLVEVEEPVEGPDLADLTDRLAGRTGPVADLIDGPLAEVTGRFADFLRG